MNETSPITIIVGAFMATLAIGLIAQQTSDFGTTAGGHSNSNQVSTLALNIESACEDVEEYGRLPISQEFEIELRGAEIDIQNGNNIELVLEENGETQSPRNIECIPGLDIESDTLGDGTSEIEITDENGDVKVEVD